MSLSGRTRLEAERLAGEICRILQESAGLSEEEIEQLLAEIDRPSSAEKLFSGLTKVSVDQCEFEAPPGLDAAVLRREVFRLAAALRKDQAEHTFDRTSILARVAEERAVSVEALEQALFSDLRGARLLVRAPPDDGEEILARYELAQVQGVLLRAVRIGLDVVCTNPDAYRGLFRKLKFRQLLHRIEPRAAGGYRIEIDGPFSLFESVTKYGLSLAQLVPALRQCQEVHLSADLRWGRARDALTFEVSLGGAEGAEPTPVRAEVLAVVDSVNRLGAGWTARLSTDLFDVPGVGIVFASRDDVVMIEPGKVTKIKGVNSPPDAPEKPAKKPARKRTR